MDSHWTQVQYSYKRLQKVCGITVVCAVYCCYIKISILYLDSGVIKSNFLICACSSAYCGGLWLASVCMMCKMARLLNCESVYQRYRDILDRGSAAFDKLLWNGEWGSLVMCYFNISVFVLNYACYVSRLPESDLCDSLCVDRTILVTFNVKARNRYWNL